jgi:hypothetical protein
VQSPDEGAESYRESALDIAESVALPILHEGNCYGVLVFHTNAEAPGDVTPAFLENLTTISSRIVEAGVYSGSRLPTFEQTAGIVPPGEEAPDGQAAEVFHMIVMEGVFNASIVYDEV